MISERAIYMICCPMMIAAAIFTAVIWHRDMASKNAPCEASKVEIEEITEETAKIDLRPVLACSTAMSGMPCENKEQFERWYREYEQETSEEVRVQQRDDSWEEVPEHESHSEVSGTEAETVQGGVLPTATVYSVNGETLNPDFQRWIYGKLTEAGIEYWYETMLCQMYQESRFSQYAVSKDGRDHGILQFRAEFWNDVSTQYGFPGADIYDPYVQVAIYIKQTAERINSGISGAEVLTRHKTSDWGVYDQQYYNEVSQWFDTIERIEE